MTLFFWFTRGLSTLRNWNCSASPANQNKNNFMFAICTKNVNQLGVWLSNLGWIAETMAHSCILLSVSKRSIFQTFWRVHCCPKFLFFKLETSNFSYLLIFWFCFNCAKFQKDWTTFILDILQGSPLWIFGRLQKQTKKSKVGPL